MGCATLFTLLPLALWFALKAVFAALRNIILCRLCRSANQNRADHVTCSVVLSNSTRHLLRVVESDQSFCIATDQSLASPFDNRPITDQARRFDFVAKCCNSESELSLSPRKILGARKESKVGPHSPFSVFIICQVYNCIASSEPAFLYVYARRLTPQQREAQLCVHLAKRLLGDEELCKLIATILADGGGYPSELQNGYLEELEDLEDQESAGCLAKLRNCLRAVLRTFNDKMLRLQRLHQRRKITQTMLTKARQNFLRKTQMVATVEGVASALNELQVLPRQQSRLGNLTADIQQTNKSNGAVEVAVSLACKCPSCDNRIFTGAASIADCFQQDLAEYYVLSLAFLPNRFGATGEPICVDDVFVPLSCEPIATTIGYESSTASKDSDAIDDFFDSNSKHKVLLLAGNPGTGKSAFIRKFCFDWAVFANRPVRKQRGQVDAMPKIFENIYLLLTIHAKDLVSLFNQPEKSAFFNYTAQIELSGLAVDCLKDRMKTKYTPANIESLKRWCVQNIDRVCIIIDDVDLIFTDQWLMSSEASQAFGRCQAFGRYQYSNSSKTPISRAILKALKLHPGAEFQGDRPQAKVVLTSRSLTANYFLDRSVYMTVFINPLTSERILSFARKYGSALKLNQTNIDAITESVELLTNSPAYGIYFQSPRLLLQCLEILVAMLQPKVDGLEHEAQESSFASGRAERFNEICSKFFEQALQEDNLENITIIEKSPSLFYRSPVNWQDLSTVKLLQQLAFKATIVESVPRYSFYQHDIELGGTNMKPGGNFVLLGGLELGFLITRVVAIGKSHEVVFEFVHQSMQHYFAALHARVLLTRFSKDSTQKIDEGEKTELAKLRKLLADRYKEPSLGDFFGFLFEVTAADEKLSAILRKLLGSASVSSFDFAKSANQERPGSHVLPGMSQSNNGASSTGSVALLASAGPKHLNGDRFYDLYKNSHSDTAVLDEFDNMSCWNGSVFSVV